MAVVTDNFNRIPEDPLAAPWANNGVDQWMILTGSHAEPQSFAADAEAHYTGSGMGADQYVQAAVTVAGTNAGSGLGVAGRGAAAAATYYRLVVNKAASNNVELARIVTGTFGLLANRTTTWVDGQVLRLEVTGVGATVTLKIFQNGAQLGADILDTDATRIVAAGSPGLAHSSTTTSGSLDTFEAGDLVSGPPPRYLLVHN